MGIPRILHKNVMKFVPLPAVDAVIVKNNKVLMIKRRIEPFRGFWCLPGGFLEYGETVEEGVIREVWEETGLKTIIKTLIGVYSNPRRDPRGHTVSSAFLLEIRGGKVKLNEESSEYKWFALKNTPDKVGFDHKEILKDAKRLLL